MADDRLIIFDTTLRDGEQSPGASMNLSEKLEVAHALRDLGVDVIEAGFPIASPGDFEAVQAIARQVQGPVICGLARCNAEDIDRAWAALRDCPRPRIHVFLATSAIHREFKLKMAKDEIVRRAVEAVQRAKAVCDDVEFSPEDAARTELDFLAEVVERVVEVGATTVNIPDTVGYAVPSQYAAAIAHLKKHVRGIDNVVISVHCHNDLGLAVANSLAAVLEGARQVECTINGIGERAGNCALEEDRHGRAHPQGLLQPRHRNQHAQALPHQPAGVARHRHPGAAQQGHRRPERLRPRGRHSPGRHAQGALHLRDHEPRGRRPAADGVGAGQAQRPARPASARAGPRLPPRRRPAAKGVRGVQGVGRPQKGHLRRRHRGAGRGPDSQQRRRRGPGGLDAGGGHLQRRLGDHPVGRGLSVAPGRPAFTARPASATGRWTRCSRPSSASPASR